VVSAVLVLGFSYGVGFHSGVKGPHVEHRVLAHAARGGPDCYGVAGGPQGPPLEGPCASRPPLPRAMAGHQYAAVPLQHSMGGAVSSEAVFVSKSSLLVKQAARGCLQECMGCEARSECKISAMDPKDIAVTAGAEEGGPPVVHWETCARAAELWRDSTST
jgi:hypothetical protein